MNTTEYFESFEKLSALVKEHLATAPGCHDFDHVQRVLHNARTILAEEHDADAWTVELAALLHDIARPEEMASKGKICHARHGSVIAVPLLEKCGFTDPILVCRVCSCVKKHRYRGSDKPETIEEKIIYDADKLDSIGAVGIGRAFHFAGRIGARLHNTPEEALASDAYSVQDSAYREYLVKLRHVPSRMLTENGRKLAMERAEFMIAFFDRMNSETSCPIQENLPLKD